MPAKSHLGSTQCLLFARVDYGLVVEFSSRIRHALREQLVLRRFTYGKHGRMLKFTLHGYRIEAGADLICPADPLEAVSSKLCFQNRRRREDTESLFGERSQQCKVLKVPDHDWVDLLRNEPLVQPAAERAIVRWDQESGVVQALWETPGFKMYSFGREKAYPALA